MPMPLQAEKSSTQKKEGHAPAAFVMVKFRTNRIAEIDAFAATQSDHPDREEAVRRLLDWALDLSHLL